MSLTSSSRSGRRLLVRTALAISSAASLGCAARLTPPPIVTKAQLGKVIIYRNGVAYFERRAAPGERELKLRVPAERVDDFLKSLSIVDDATSEALPVSYPTLKQDGGAVEMVIGLPEHGGALRITYVTESPSWKPSYRLVVGAATPGSAGGKARLQAWAVVDNVSGEDWKDVRIGVGSTSALSFRYDLHSVRLVERETLVSSDMLAIAPPTGGSPFGGKDLQQTAQAAAQELAKLGDDDYRESTLARSTGEYRKGERRDSAGKEPDEGSFDGATSGSFGVGGGGGLPKRGAMPNKSAKGPTAVATPAGRPALTPPPPAPPQDPRKVAVLDARLANARELAKRTASMLRAGQRLRVEGYARKGDAAPERDALDRANRVRNRLIAEGVPADRIDAVGMSRFNSEPVTVTVAEEDKQAAEKPPAAEAPSGEPLGQAHFVSTEALTIASDHSAMVSILQAEAQAERVYYYDPISARGSKDFAFNAIRLQNPSDYMLDSGPFTIYSEGQFLGEGLSEPVLPRATTFIPYALDRIILVETDTGSREEIDKLVAAQRGIATCEARRVRTTKLTLHNRGIEPATVYVRHSVQPGYELAGDRKGEKLGLAHLFRVAVAAGASVELLIEEKTPIIKTIDINGEAGIGEVKLFLDKGRMSDDILAGLQRIVAHHEQAADVKQRIETLDEQMQVLRTRVDEINFQLVTLKKLPHAERLRTHLSDRMQEISDRLQKATFERAELDGRLMTARIELQDAVAELIVDKPDSAAPAAITIGAKP